MLQLLCTFSWQELRHHPWRNAAAVLAVMLGVALAFSVHLINASALDEFSQAVRSVNGQPDLELRGVQARFDETLYARVAADPQVVAASPVLELDTYAVGASGQRSAIRVVGVDALLVSLVAPSLQPVPNASAGRFAFFAPDQVFLNAAAQVLAKDDKLRIQSGLALLPVTVAGNVSASGPPLAVMDLGAAQDLFGKIGQLSRIDLRLQPGTDKAAWLQQLALPPDISAIEPRESATRASNLSRAYRVNLTVLALVALFTGAFLVFSVLSLSVAKRAQQFALLGVLGLTGSERLRLVLWESLVLGGAGSAVGIGLGTALAALALNLLGGDLGGGYFQNQTPHLQFDALAALLYGTLGTLAALVGGWWPARAAQRLPPAQTLKGLGAALGHQHPSWAGAILIATAAVLAWAPPVFGIPLAAYVAVGLLLVGGITTLPALISMLYDRLAPRVGAHLLPMLAVERARRVRESASVAVSGVVASLSLAVALTVMVASFRASMMDWLDVVLPADLYARTATQSGAADTVYFSPELVQAVAQVPGVRAVTSSRQISLLLDATRPPVALVTRPLSQPERNLPLVGNVLAVPPGHVGIYVSEPMVDLYGARLGSLFKPLSDVFFTSNVSQAPVPQSSIAPFFVAGVWRDYARQFGTIAIAQEDFERLTGDRRANDMAITLQSGADAAQVQQAIRALADRGLTAMATARTDAGPSGAGNLLEFASTAQIRATSLRIFDRSFAVTYWLQAVAIAIGLFGVAASFSAQVLARRKEFGLLIHLGLTRRQILAVVAGEGLAWTAVGSIAGLGLGLAVAVVLVHVVNPQSFHWTMDLLIPWLRLVLLCLAVMLAGTATAWVAGRAAAGRDAVLAVKEDW